MNRNWSSKLARWLFAASGLYGIAVLAPLYLLEGEIAKTTAPFNHPEYFYGFVGTALAAQIMFFVIAYDPLRFRPAMLFGVLEKLAFAIPVCMLWASGRVTGPVVVFGGIDFLWAITFATLWMLTTERKPQT
jgi:hypothetical protein